jgi:hypothetical protein
MSGLNNCSLLGIKKALLFQQGLWVGDGARTRDP